MAVAIVIGSLIVTAVPAGAVDSPGTKLWGKRYDGPASGDDAASDLATTSDGTTVVVTGKSDGGASGTDYATRAYDASTGATLWTQRYDGVGHFSDDATSIAISPDDSLVFVTGESSATTNENDFDYATVAYDTGSGDKVWAKRYNGPASSNDVPFSAAVSPDGQAVFVTGTSISTAGSFDFATLAYSATTGQTLWRSRFDGKAHGIDEALGIVAAPDGSAVFVTGESWSAHNAYDMETVAYSATGGDLLWSRRLDGPAHETDYAQALTINADGSRLFVTGTTAGLGTNRDYTTIAYNPTTGGQAWVVRWAGPFDGDDVAESIVVSSDGSKVIVGGFLQLIGYDATDGSELWNKQLSAYYLPSLAVTPDGSKVIATGSYFGGTGDVATFALDPSTGAKVWARHVDGPGAGEDAGASIAVSADGARVFVGGRSTGAGTGLDYITLAYAT